MRVSVRYFYPYWLKKSYRVFEKGVYGFYVNKVLNKVYNKRKQSLSGDQNNK